MPRFEDIRDRLPSLYRPENGDNGLLSLLLRAVARTLDEAGRDANDVLQSHWFGFADRALYNPFFMRVRELSGQPVPRSNDPELLSFPYIRDLGHIGGLLGIPPWEEPPPLRERVEDYWTRVSRIVTLYRNGLGTVDALRSMVEAQLPVESASSQELRDRPFWVEELAPGGRQSVQVKARGEPLDMVGPLMRWTLSNKGLRPVAPTVYIEGVAPEAGLVDPTERPLIELYSAGDSRPRLGIASLETVAPGDTLRLRPAGLSWLATEEGLQRAQSLPTSTSGADPTAPGPWMPVEGPPDTRIAAMLQSGDRMLWAATNQDGAGELWRHDGAGWSRAIADLPPVACLAEDGPDLLIGTATGLFRMDLFPEDGAPFEALPVPDLQGHAVQSVLKASDGRWWVGTTEGAFRLGEHGEILSTELADTTVYGIHEDETGALTFGTTLGLFQFQPFSGHWYWYSGLTHTEQEPDWQRFFPGSLPPEDQVGLPSVKAVHRGRDASLWVGTEQGIARYRARPVGESSSLETVTERGFARFRAKPARGLTYTTVLEAFPDLTTGEVTAIEEDARGLVWFCTDRGLFRYDGRDWWHHVSDTWIPLGRADTLYDDPARPRGAWRFQRSRAQWQRFGEASLDWEDYRTAPRTSVAPTVRSVCWTDSVDADLGQWDGTTFTPALPIARNMLRMRCKPSEQRLVDGGIPAIPRIPPGSSTWRYLSLEPEALPEPLDRPAWTIEGRLLPPPEDLDAAGEGRWSLEAPPPSSNFDEAVYAYQPAARVWLEWEEETQMTLLVRLKRRAPDERIDPAILDRVWQSIQQVRPAGSRVLLAFEEEIVKGKDNG